MLMQDMWATLANVAAIAAGLATLGTWLQFLGWGARLRRDEQLWREVLESTGLQLSDDLRTLVGAVHRRALALLLGRSVAQDRRVSTARWLLLGALLLSAMIGWVAALESVRALTGSITLDEWYLSIRLYVLLGAVGTGLVAAWGISLSLGQQWAQRRIARDIMAGQKVRTYTTSDAFDYFFRQREQGNQLVALGMVVLVGVATALLTAGTVFATRIAWFGATHSAQELVPQGQTWFNWAIACAFGLVVGTALVILSFRSWLGRPAEADLPADAVERIETTAPEPPRLTRGWLRRRQSRQEDPGGVPAAEQSSE